VNLPRHWDAEDAHRFHALRGTPVSPITLDRAGCPTFHLLPPFRPAAGGLSVKAAVAEVERLRAIEGATP